LKLSALEAFKRDVILGLWLLRVSLLALAHRQGVTCGERLLRLIRTLRDEGMLDFDGDSIVLAQEHRFGAGAVMNRLASLEIEAWGNAPTLPSAAPSTVSNERRFHPSAELTTILRMARRDPAFFNALNCNPGETLERLDHDLRGEELSGLCDVISGVQPSERAGYSELETLWTAVRDEHQHTSLSKTQK
jgi:hypothetical protein